MKSEKIIGYTMASALVVILGVFLWQNYTIVSRENQALAGGSPTPDMSWRGYKRAVIKYERSRAPDYHYSTESHQNAAWTFLHVMAKNHHPRTVHWAAVRLITETMKLTLYYEQQEKNRDAQHNAPAPTPVR